MNISALCGGKGRFSQEFKFPQNSDRCLFFLRLFFSNEPIRSIAHTEYCYREREKNFLYGQRYAGSPKLCRLCVHDVELQFSLMPVCTKERPRRTYSEPWLEWKSLSLLHRPPTSTLLDTFGIKTATFSYAKNVCDNSTLKIKDRS